MGGKGGGGTNTQQNQNVQYTPYGQQNLQNIYNAAANAASQPYRGYTGQLVAGLTPGQKGALQGINQAQGTANPFYQRAAGITNNAAAMANQGSRYVGQGANMAGNASGLIAQGAQAQRRGIGMVSDAANPISGADIKRYQDPYTEQVINATMADMQRQNTIQQQGVTGNAAMQGALGGDRSAIAQAEMAKDQNMNMAQVISNLQNQGYGQALQTAQSQQQAEMQGGQQVGALGQGLGSMAATQGNIGSQLAGMGGQQAGIAGQYGALGQQYAGLGSGLENQKISGAMAQMQGETQRQQTQQANLSAQYQQYQQMLAFPYQQAQFLASIGLPATQAMGGYQTQIGQIGEQVQPPWWNLNRGGKVPNMAKGGKTTDGSTGTVTASTFSPYFFNADPGNLPNHAGRPIYLPGQTIQPMSQLIGPSGPFGNSFSPTGPSSNGTFTVYGAIPIGSATHPSDLQNYVAAGGNSFKMPWPGGVTTPTLTSSSTSSVSNSSEVVDPHARGGSIGHYAPGGATDDNKMPWDIGAYDITGGGSMPGTMTGQGMPKLQVSDARPVPMPMAPPSHPPQQQSPIQALSQMMSLGKQATGLFKPGVDAAAKGLSGATSPAAATPSAAPATLSGAEGGSGLAGAGASGGASPATLAGLESGSGLSGVGTAAAGANLGTGSAGGLGASEAAGMMGATGAEAGLGAAGASDAAAMTGAGAAGAEAAGAATAEAAADAAAMTGAAGVAGAAGAEALGGELAADVAGGLGALGALFLLARGGAVGRYAKGGSVSKHPTIPEARHTLLAQQKQLVSGSRRVQMFPVGTAPLQLPAGMKSMSTPAGVFHYDPTKISAGKIKKASAEGRENEILDLGPFSKDDVLKRAKKGERPLVVVERDRLGREVKTAAGTSKTAGHQASVLKKHKSAGHTVHIEDPRKVLAERMKRPVGLAYGGEVNGYDDGGEVGDSDGMKLDFSNYKPVDPTTFKGFEGRQDAPAFSGQVPINDNLSLHGVYQPSKYDRPGYGAMLRFHKEFAGGGKVKGYDDGGDVEDDGDDDYGLPYNLGLDSASQAPIDHGDIVPHSEAPKVNPLASNPGNEMAANQVAAALAGGSANNPFDSASGLDSKAIKAALGMADAKPVIPDAPKKAEVSHTDQAGPGPDSYKPSYADPSGGTHYNPFDSAAGLTAEDLHKALAPPTANASLPPPNNPQPDTAGTTADEAQRAGWPQTASAFPLPQPRPAQAGASAIKPAADGFDATANQRAAAAMGYTGDSPEMRAAVSMDNARVMGGFGGTGTTLGGKLTASAYPQVSPALAAGATPLPTDRPQSADKIPLPQGRPQQEASLAPQPLPAGMSRPPANVPEHLAPAINSVAQNYGAHPTAVASVLKVESNFNPRAQTGSYLGLPQMSMTDLRELGYNSKQDFLNAPPSAQIAAYGHYLDKYGFSDKMKASGIDFASLPPEKQAAVLQGFQFAPNATSWMKAAGQGNWNVPTTNTTQARALGDTSLNQMTSYFAHQQGTPVGGATNAGAPFPAATPSVSQRMTAMQSITHDPLRTLINIGASDFTHGSGPMVMQGLQRTVGDYDKFSRDDLSAEQKASELGYKLQALATPKMAPVNLDMGGGKTAIGAFDTKSGNITAPGSHDPITGANAIAGKTTNVTQTANSKAIDARWAAKERLSNNPALDPTTILNEERTKRGMPPATPTEAKTELQGDTTQPAQKTAQAKDGSSATNALPDPGDGKRVKGKWYVAPDGKPRPWQG